MSENPPPRVRTWRIWAATAAVAALAAGAIALQRSESPPEIDAPRAAPTPSPHGSRDFDESPPPTAEAEPREVAVRALFGTRPVQGARVQVVPLDFAHGAVAPACACEPDGGIRDEGDAPSEDDLPALDEACESCAPSVDALFELAGRGAGFLASAEGQTDADGIARIPVAPGGDPQVAVWVQAAGFAPSSILTRVRDAADARPPDEVDLALSSALPVHVQDEDGNPVAAAEIAAFSDTPFQPLTPVVHGSDALLEAVPTGVDVHVLARAPGLLPAHVVVDEAQPPLTLTLERPRLLTGRVLHGDAPVAGATVQLSADSRDDARATRSGPDGRFSFAELPPGSYTLSGELGALRGSTDVELDGDPGEVALLLSERARVDGVVTDAATGKPLPGVQVDLRATAPAGAPDDASGPDGFIVAQTDAAGHFQLDAAPGTYALHANDAAHPELVLPVAVTEGAPVHLALALQAGIELAGTVSDSQGNPLEAHLTLETAQSGDASGESHVRSGGADATGHFDLKGLAAGPHVLTATADGHPPLALALDLPADGPLALQLADGAAIDGVVLGPDGPLAGATVEPSQNAHARAAQTDASGAFHFDGLPAGPCTLVATAAGMAESDPVPVQLAAGQSAHVELHLSPGLTIRGHAVDDSGKPVAGALVEAHPSKHAPDAPVPALSATADAQGAFTLTGLGPGTYWMLAYHDGLEQLAPVSAPAGATGVALTLQRGARVTGKVVSADGEPVRSFSVEGQDFHSAEGRFTLTAVAPDATELYVEGAFPSVRVPVQLQPGVTADVGTITVDSGQPLTGEVLDADGQPVASAQVTALPPGFDASAPDDPSGADPILDSPRTAATDADGHFAFDHLRPGAYLVQASTPGASSEAVRASTGGDVQLHLQPGATVRGRASLSDGTPIGEGTAIFVGGAMTAQAQVVDGAFELSGLPAGAGQVVVTGYAPLAGHVSASQAVNLAAGQAAQVSVTLGARFGR